MEFFFMLMVPIYLPMAIMGFTRKLIINFVNEKSEKYKEYQKVLNNYNIIQKNKQIMGVNSTSYTLGWIFTSYITGFLVNIKKNIIYYIHILVCYNSFSNNFTNRRI